MRPHFLHSDANYGVNFLNTPTYVSLLLSVDYAWFVSRLYHTFIARINFNTLRGLARALSESALQLIYIWRGITHSKIKDPPGKVANPARGQLNRENEYFPVYVRNSM